MNENISLLSEKSYDMSKACYHHANLTRTCLTSQIRREKAASNKMRPRAKNDIGHEYHLWLGVHRPYLKTAFSHC